MGASVGLDALGLTASALVLFVMGALAAWVRAAISGTQVTWSQRTVADLLAGGFGAVMLPVFAPVINRMLGVQFETWTTLQQACLAFILGGGWSWLWTAIGWRNGRIATPEQVATGEKPPPPQIGVLKGTREAEVAADRVRSAQAAAERTGSDAGGARERADRSAE